MSTKAEVRNRAAELLGRLRVGQSINDALKIRLDDAYDEVYKRLKTKQLTIWAQTGTIPDEVMPFLAVLMAQNAQLSMGVSDERAQRILIEAGPNGDTAISQIRDVTTPPFDSVTNVEDF